MKILNIEINELPPEILNDYIEKNRKSCLAKSKQKGDLIIYTTEAIDVEKEKLYPSQTWASFYTGKPYSQHRCYWYSDYIDPDQLLWNQIESRNISST